MTERALIGDAFARLADTLAEDFDLTELVNLLCTSCVDLLEIDEAGVALADDRGTLRPLASSSGRMGIGGLGEVQAASGPGYDAWRTGEPVRCDDLADEPDRWRPFGPAALADGFRSAYALPMRARSRCIGALCLLAGRRAALPPCDQRLGQALAGVTTIGILQDRLIRERTDLADHLQRALDSRVVIEQAKGILAEQGSLDIDDAFDRLRRHARSSGIHLHDVADQVIGGTLTASQLVS